ncbi:MAG: hypothetical protein ACAF41_14890 [Leptolyngbya sp. BL-A-14]
MRIEGFEVCPGQERLKRRYSARKQATNSRLGGLFSLDTLMKEAAQRRSTAWGSATIVITVHVA